MCGIWFYQGDADTSMIISKFMQISGRGPETYSFNMIDIDNIKNYLGFHRLSINGLSGTGNQPFIKDFEDTTIYTICNGEIYNYAEIMQTYKFPVSGKSDCEVLPYLYMKYGEFMPNMLDGEYAFIMLIVKNNKWRVYAARDPFGVRPLFYGLNKNNKNICMASEIKAITGCDDVFVFPPGHIFTLCDGVQSFKQFYQGYDIKPLVITKEMVYNKIRDVFTECVRKRLQSDRPVGCLLSGGLDSSMVSAVANSLFQEKGLHNLTTFTIGLEGATDIEYASMAAEYIGVKSHHTFIVTMEEALKAIPEVIRVIESYDTTTVRASVWQYLLGKKIREKTNIKVLLTGEGSDELMSGYMYFYNAPADEMHGENIRLLQDIHKYDGLRVDRAMSHHGLEVRIPFLDPEFVELILSLPAEWRRPTAENMEKKLFRDSFKTMLPDKVLYRKKEAFSDGTSTNEKSWYQIIQEHLDKTITDAEYLENKKEKEDTKEKYYYRKIFQMHYGEQALSTIPYYWLPKWSGNITEPSARVLDVYRNGVKK